MPQLHRMMVFQLHGGVRLDQVDFKRFSVSVLELRRKQGALLWHNSLLRTVPFINSRRTCPISRLRTILTIILPSLFSPPYKGQSALSLEIHHG